MTSDLQYWCYINNSEEFEYIKNLHRVKYEDDRIKGCPESPIVFNLDLRETSYTPFWVFNSDSNFLQCPSIFFKLSFEKMKSQIFIHQLTL